MSIPSGTRPGPYRIDALIGEGGRGQVYRGLDTRLDRTVAIKVLASHSFYVSRTGARDPMPLHVALNWSVPAQ